MVKQMLLNRLIIPVDLVFKRCDFLAEREKSLALLLCYREQLDHLLRCVRLKRLLCKGVLTSTHGFLRLRVKNADFEVVGEEGIQVFECKEIFGEADFICLGLGSQVIF
jgi:hypothetical protein